MDPPSPSTPPSPLVEPHTRRRAGRRSSKEHLFGGSTKDLARLLVFEEREAQELRDSLYTVTERLKAESQRADEAENRAREAVLHFKELNNAKLAALQEANRANEELGLYKLQLDNAQREINRAQELLDAVEAQRVEAEEAAARARSTARRLKEERVIHVAREEGRRQGIEEGIARGRRLGYEEGRAAGYERGRAASARDYGDYPETPYDSGENRNSNSSSHDTDSRRNTRNYTQPLDQSLPVPPPVTTPFYTPIPASERRRSPPTNYDRPPTIVHNAVPSPSHPPVDILPLGYIPEMDADKRIRLPPPHELGPPPPTPSPPASVTLQHLPAEEEPTLMIPPPNQATADSDSDSFEAPVRRPRHVRRRSSESQSTTMSQLEMLRPPSENSAQYRANVLSAIAEERERSSSLSSPVVLGSNGSPYISLAAPMATPRPDVGRLEANANQGTYTRSRTSLSPNDSLQDPSSLSRSSSVQDGSVYQINVVAPSRPESTRSGIVPGPATPGLLGVADAQRQLPPVSEPQTIIEPAPILLPEGEGLPPGFIPSGPAIPIESYIQTPRATPRGTSYGSQTPAAIPLPPSAIPTLYRLQPSTPSVAGSSVIPGAFPLDQVVIPAPSGDLARYYRREALKDSSDSDDAVSSGVEGSLDSLTTPPQRVYQVPPTPMSTGSYTSRAARVPLPPSTIAGSPRSSYSQTPHSRGYNVDAGRTPAMLNRSMTASREDLRRSDSRASLTSSGRIHMRIVPDDSDDNYDPHNDVTRSNTAANAAAARRTGGASSPSALSALSGFTGLSTVSKKSKSKRRTTTVETIPE